MKFLQTAAAAAMVFSFADLAMASTGPLPCTRASDAVPASACFGDATTLERRGRGRGKDDGAGHTALTVPAAPVQEARRGRGADDPAGHTRHGRGKDDPVGHG